MPLICFSSVKSVRWEPYFTQGCRKSFALFSTFSILGNIQCIMCLQKLIVSFAEIEGVKRPYFYFGGLNGCPSVLSKFIVRFGVQISMTELRIVRVFLAQGAGLRKVPSLLIAAEC
jgi:hypothetical protein